MNVKLCDGLLDVKINDRNIVFESDVLKVECTCDFLNENSAKVNIIYFTDKLKNRTYRSNKFNTVKHIKNWCYTQCLKLRELNYITFC